MAPDNESMYLPLVKEYQYDEACRSMIDCMTYIHHAQVRKGEHRKQGRYADSAPTNIHILTPPCTTYSLLTFPLSNHHTQPPPGHKTSVYPSAHTSRLSSESAARARGTCKEEESPLSSSPSRRLFVLMGCDGSEVRYERSWVSA